jgi:hypothetical protein
MISAPFTNPEPKMKAVDDVKAEFNEEGTTRMA